VVLTRRAFLKKSLAAGAVPAAGCGLYGLYEPFRISVTRLEIRLRRLPTAFDGFRLVQISDLHFGPFTGASEIGAAVRAVNTLNPDLCVITGDFVSIPVAFSGIHWSGDPEAAARKIIPCAELLAGIRAPQGSVAVLGNHDVGTDPNFVAGHLSERNIAVLRNAAIPIERGGARLWVVGLDDADYNLMDISRALATVPAGEATIVLVHEPDVADQLARYPADLQLSGHSHGGQIRIPLLPPLYLPSLAKKYYEGLYRIGNLQLYTSRGIGTIGLPMRFDCLPEVTLFTLRAG